MRWSVSQFLFVVTFVALAIGLSHVAWEAANRGETVGVSFSEKGKYAAAVAYDANRREDRIQLWRVENGIPSADEPITDLVGPLATRSIGFLNDSELWCLVYEESAESPVAALIVDIQKEEIISRQPLPYYPRKVVCFDNAGNAAILSELGLKLVNLRDGTKGPTLQQPWNNKVLDDFDANDDHIVGVSGQSFFVWEKSSGRMIRRKDLDHSPSAVYLSHDGQWFCTRESQDSPLQVWDTEWIIPVHQVEVAPALYKFDEDQMIVIVDDELRQLDLSTGQFLSSDSRRFDQGVVRGVSATGIAAIETGKQLALWDVSHGVGIGESRLVNPLIADETSRNIVIYTLGFAIWSWALGAYLQKQISAAGEQNLREMTKAYLKRAKRFKALSLAQVRLLLLLKFVLLCVLLSYLGRTLSDGTWFGFLWRYALFVLSTLCLIAILVTFLQFLVRRVLWQYYPEMKRLEQSASQPIRQRTFANVRLLAVGPTSFEEEFEDVYAGATERLSAFVGNEVKPSRVMVACFELTRDMQSFIGRPLWHAGIFTGLKRYRTMVFCEEVSDELLVSRKDILNSISAYHLTESHYGCLVPAWLSFILLEQLQVDPDHRLVDLSHRRLISQPSRLMEAGTTFLSQCNRRQNIRDVVRYHKSSAFRRVTERTDVGRTFAYYVSHVLLPNDRERIRLMLGQHQENSSTIINAHFDCPMQELVREWKRWLIDRPVGPHYALCDRLEQRLVEKSVPKLLSRDVDFKERARIARAVGNAGVFNAVPALLTVLMEANDQLNNKSARRFRDDTLWALRSISGQDLGEKHKAWVRWWKAENQTNLEPVAPLTVSPTLKTAELKTVPQLEVYDPTGAFERPPNRLVRFCLKLVAFGGLTAILVSVAMLLVSGWFLNPLHYLGIGIGCFAIVRAAARKWRKLQSTSIYLAANILNADIVSFSIGIAVLILMRLGTKKEF